MCAWLLFDVMCLPKARAYYILVPYRLKDSCFITFESNTLVSREVTDGSVLEQTS